MQVMSLNTQAIPLMHGNLSSGALLKSFSTCAYAEARSIFIIWDFGMLGMRRVTFLSQAALDSYFGTRKLRAFIQLQPAQSKQTMQLSALELEGTYCELPRNALPGSTVTKLQRAAVLFGWDSMRSYPTDMGWDPAEAACRAAWRVHLSFLVGGESFLGSWARKSITMFQKQILSEGLAASLHVLPHVSWLPEPKPAVARHQIDCVLHDGAETVFLCSLGFVLVFSLTQSWVSTYKMIEKLAEDAKEMQAQAAALQSESSPLSILRNMRVAPVVMLALAGDFEKEHVEAAVQACQERQISVFTLDFCTLHIAQPWTPKQNRPPSCKRVISTSAKVQDGRWDFNRQATRHSRCRQLDQWRQSFLAAGNANLHCSRTLQCRYPSIM